MEVAGVGGVSDDEFLAYLAVGGVGGCEVGGEGGGGSDVPAAWLGVPGEDVVGDEVHGL